MLLETATAISIIATVVAYWFGGRDDHFHTTGALLYLGVFPAAVIGADGASTLWTIGVYSAGATLTAIAAIAIVK